jgi:DNA-binding beta-propeller fold protein YncE
VNQSLLFAPESVSFDPTNDRLFVTDSGNNRALVFKVAKIINGMNASKVLGQADFTTRDSYTTQSGFNNPRQVFYDRGSGRLFVSDYNISGTRPPSLLCLSETEKFWALRNETLSHKYLQAFSSNERILLANPRTPPSGVRASMINRRFLALLDNSPTVSVGLLRQEKS